MKAPIISEQILTRMVLYKNKNDLTIFLLNLETHMHDVEYFYGCLSRLEKERAKKFTTEVLYARYVISHGILRHILSAYVGVPPKALEFFYNAFGKPFLRNSSIQFNMSYSNQKAVYILSPYHYVGIDIEYHDHDLNIKEFLEEVFTPYEKKIFGAIEINQKLDFFYQVWTAKESLIKANGKGLSYPLTEVEVKSIKSNLKTCILKENREHKTWYFSQMKHMSNYHISYASEYQYNKVMLIEKDINDYSFNSYSELKNF